MQHDDPIENYKKLIKRLISQNALTPEICLDAVNTHGSLLAYIPPKMRSKTICQEAVRSYPIALQYLIPFKQNSILKPEEYKTVCIEAIKYSIFAIQFVDEKFKLAVVLGIFENYKSIFRALFESINEISLKPFGLSEKEYEDICLEITPMDPLIFEFLSEDMKAKIIKALSPEKILSINYGVRKFFPKRPDFTSEINKFLSQVEHVVVTKDNDFAKDHEIKDFCLNYAHKPKCVGKTIHTEEKDVQTLLDDIKSTRASIPINLVLIDHANRFADALGGMDVEDIVAFVEKNELINRITLLGCNTVQSEKLEEEKQLINAYEEDQSQLELLQNCGFILLSRQVNALEYSKFLKMVNLNQTYLFIKYEMDGKEQYELIDLQKDLTEEKKIIEIHYLLDEEDAKNLLTQFKTGKGDRYDFPANQVQTLVIRGGGVRSLNEDEIISIDDAIGKPNIYDRSQLGYSKLKKKFPYFRNFEIDSSEAHKLSESLFQKLYEAIKHLEDKKIKGYSHFLSINTKTRMTHAATNLVYWESYKKNKKSRFSQGKQNIDAAKLNKEMKKMHNQLKKKETTGPTSAKSITIKTPSRKND